MTTLYRVLYPHHSILSTIIHGFSTDRLPMISSPMRGATSYLGGLAWLINSILLRQCRRAIGLEAIVFLVPCLGLTVWSNG
jgi:hypothetical protein